MGTNQYLFEIIGFVASIATLAALILSIVQLKAASRQTKALETISSSSSTRYIGEFPDYLSLITAAIEKAEKEISIFCDFPAYGCFSNREKWLKYKHAIEDKLENSKIHVEITFLDRDGRQRFSPEQFEKPDSRNPWEDWKEERQKQLTHFLEQVDPGLVLDRLTKQEFLDILESMNRIMLEDTLRKAKKYEVRIDMPVYFWLIDKRLAFFAFRYSNKSMECGFSTIDKPLIESLEQMQIYFQKVLSSEGLRNFNYGSAEESKPRESHNSGVAADG